MIPRLLFSHGYVELFAVRPCKVAVWHVEEASGMSLKGGITLIILSRRLLIEAYVVALLKGAGAINEAGS